MPLAEGQWQVRDLVMGPLTAYRLLDSSNPFDLAVRADQGGPRAWNHGTWSGAEFASERVVPIRLHVEGAGVGGWLTAHQQLAAAFAPVGDLAETVELRFVLGGSEYVLFGRPRLVEPDVTLIGTGQSHTRCGFVAQDPRIYSGLLHTGQTGLPVQTGGLTIPGVSATTPPFGLLLPGASDYASTPDHPSLDITGDVDLRADITPDSWTPAATEVLVAKYDTGANQRSYALSLLVDGKLRLNWSTDGTAASSADSTVPVPSALAARLVVRGAIDVDNGASGRTITFWYSTGAGIPFTQLGDPVVQAGVTSIHSGTAEMSAGAFAGGSTSLAGTIHAAEVRAGIGGTVVASPDFARQPNGTTSCTDSTGKVWTVQGLASINGQSTTGGLTIPFTIPGTLVGGSAPLLNAGTTAAGLVVRVDGPLPQPQLVLQQPGGTVQSVRFDLDLATGQWLDVDSVARTCLLNGLPQSNQRGRAVWDMDPFPLLPGTNTLRFLSGGFDPAALATASWRDAWW